MAEGISDAIDPDMSLNTTDDKVEIICDPCKEDGNNILAHGFCTDCNEYLCDSCYSSHLKPRPCRNHVLLDSTHMPKCKSETPKTNDEASATEKCHLHPENEITSYCRTDDQLCCKECIDVLHCVCTDVCLIADLISEEDVQKEFDEFEKTIVEVNKAYTENNQKAEAHLILIDKIYQNALDRVEAKLRDIKSKDIAKITEIRDKNEKVLKQVAMLSTTYEGMKANDDKQSCFKYQRRNRQQLSAMVKNNVPLTEDNLIVRYNAVDSDESDGQVILEIRKTPYLLKKINVKLEDEKKCTVLDMAKLGESLLVTDKENKTIKLAHIGTNQIISHTKLESEIITITCVNGKEAYITQPEEKRILKLTEPLTDVSKFDVIPVDGKCYVARYCDGKLKVQFSGPSKQQEIGLDGTVLRTIHEDVSTVKSGDDGKNISSLVFGSINPTNNAFLLTSWPNNIIAEVTDNGKANVLLQSNQFSSPHGIVALADGSVIVCSFDKRNVYHVLEKKYVCEVLPEPVDFDACSIAFDDISQRLYVGGISDSVLVYQL